ncbi:MAG: cytochrome P450, partial [Ilumatobacteraceae bacterium]
LSIINCVAPEHTKRRRLVGHGFTPRRVADHEPYLRAKVTQLIDAVIDTGHCDIVTDIATPLPMYMIGQLMDLPETDHDTLLHWSDLFATGGDQIQAEVVEAVMQWNEYIMGKVAERRHSDAEDLVSLIVNAEWEGESLSDVDIMFETMLVLVGGDETTRHVISGGVAALLQNPDQLQMLQNDMSLLPGAIEEMLRWATPVRNMNRTATHDVEVNGYTIRENDRVLLLYPSANRDEKVFADPFRFDITRNPNDHVAFGAYGRHHCLGAPLARLELRILFEEMLTRLDDLHLASDHIEWRTGNFVLGPNTVPITFTAR